MSKFDFVVKILWQVAVRTCSEKDKNPVMGLTSKKSQSGTKTSTPLPGDLATLTRATANMILNIHDPRTLKMTSPDPDSGVVEEEEPFSCCIKSPNLPAVMKVDLDMTPRVPKDGESVRIGKVKQIVRSVEKHGLNGGKQFRGEWEQKNTV